MEWTIEYLEEESILSVKTKGILTAASANEMIKAIVLAMAHYQCTAQIVDHRETNSTLTVSEYYRRPEINEQLGISRTWKIAMLFKELNADTAFMENVFRNRGFNFRVFADPRQAKTWVTDE